MTHPTSGFAVAVVDDDESVLRSLEHVLESADHAVRLFTSGTALLESGCLPEIDCLISDLDAPDMDGIEVLKRISVIRPGLPTILITGYPDRVELLTRLRGIYPGLFTKPLQPEELLAAVSDVFRNPDE